MASEFEEEVLDEFARLFLQEMDRAIVDSEAEVTIEMAKDVRASMKRMIAFEEMMLEFIGQVMQRMPGDTWVIQFNDEHLKWIRSYHQINQRAKLYKGGKFPELLGVPIHVRNDITAPILRDELSHGVILP